MKSELKSRFLLAQAIAGGKRKVHENESHDVRAPARAQTQKTKHRTKKNLKILNKNRYGWLPGDAALLLLNSREHNSRDSICQ